MNALAPDTWRRLLRRAPADAALSSLYGPLLCPPTAPDGCYVLGRIAQSLDGRIATASGASQWISGQEDVVHMHRLRALFDALVIGAGTVRADDPQLTTRAVEGPSPVRVVLDTNRRLHGDYRVFREGPETLLLCATDAAGADRVGRAPVLRLPRKGEALDIVAVLATLAERGLRRVYVEGGGITVSRFLAAGALDRLHISVAPLVIGSGPVGLTLAPIDRLEDALRPVVAIHRLGADLLFDCAFS